MRPVTVALLVAGVAGAGAAVYFFVIKPRQAAAVAAGGAALAVGPPPANPKMSTGPASVIAAVTTGSHVDRKNALAPTIISNVTGGIIPQSTASKISGIAAKFDISAKAQNYISTKVPIVGKIAEAPVKAVKSIVSGIASLF